MAGISLLVVAAILALPSAACAWTFKYASGPDPAAQRWPQWPAQLACGGVSVEPALFAGPTTAEDGAGAPETALREYLQAELHPSLPKDNWREIASTGTAALFSSGRLELGLTTLAFEATDGGWKVSGSPGDCKAHSVGVDEYATSWKRDPGQRLGATSRRLRIEVRVSGCPPPTRAELDPELARLGNDVVIFVWRPVPHGPQKKCRKVATYGYAPRLPGRLGKRHVWDGTTYPPLRVG